MTDQDLIRSDFLFARPSFLEGVGRIIDVAGSLNMYNVSRTGEEADARAIYEDWKALGSDMRVALEQLRHDTEQSRRPTDE